MHFNGRYGMLVDGKKDILQKKKNVKGNLGNLSGWRYWRYVRHLYWGILIGN